MSNEARTIDQKDQSQSTVSDTASIILGGKSYEIKRLKAGDFYRALKVYMEMIKDVIPDKDNTPSTPITTDGKAETKEVGKTEFRELIESVFERWPDKKAEIIGICCSTIEGETKIDKQFVLTEAYPEEIDTILNTCTELNRFGENLKNFAAPMVGLKGLNLVPKAS
jgi:hypothetical protein